MKKNFFIYLFLLIISFGLVLDLFVNKGQPVTFDGPTHITNIAMFYKSLKEGNIQVTWTDGFANYGMPLGLMAQQVTSYLGAYLNFIFNNPLFSYNMVFFIGAFFSNLFFYLFLRRYFSELISLAGVFIFNLAPYRIINIYIRGALSEFFASVFFPLILIGIDRFFEKKDFFSFGLISFFFALLILTHPFMIIIFGFFFGIYIIFKLINIKKNLSKNIFLIFLSFLIGLLLASYFIIPLSLELKYFYYGLAKNHFNFSHFLTWKNFFDPNWYYFYKEDIAPRGHFMKTGVIEILLVISYWLFLALRKKFKDKEKPLVFTLFFTSIFYLIFLTSISSFLYKKISFLSNIQHAWRMLSGFIFIPPIAFCFIAKKNFKNKEKLMLFFIIIIFSILRIPQLYGKNYQFVNQKNYFFTKENLHAVILNTIWTGKSEDYPTKEKKGEIIEGKGKLKIIEVKNNFRKYQLNAFTPVRLVDYTFYFPGWRVYVSGKKIPIEFQDPNYRGVITYKLDKGNYNILVKFEDTKERIFGKFLSILGLIFLSFFYVKRKNIFNY